MKLIKIITNCGMVIATSLLVTSCVKETGKEVAFEETGLNNKSFLQVFNATVNSSRTYVYADSKPLTGAALAYAGTFPATPANFGVTPGYREFLIRDTLAASTQVPLSFAESFQPNSYYTIFMYDTINAAKQKTVQNNIVIPTDTTARLRFANFVYSPGVLTAFDLFSKRRGTNVFTNVQITDVTSYIPYASALIDTFYLRPTGTTTNVLNNYGTVAAPNIQPLQLIFNPARYRSYTIILRGGWRTDLESAATVRRLSVFANY